MKKPEHPPLFPPQPTISPGKSTAPSRVQDLLEQYRMSYERMMHFRASLLAESDLLDSLKQDLKLAIREDGNKEWVFAGWRATHHDGNLKLEQLTRTQHAKTKTPQAHTP